MERNEVSFSIPMWRSEQVRSIDLAEEEALYMTSPYNLNDFKNTHPSVEHIFHPRQQPSDLKAYLARRQLHPKVPKEVALFTTFLYQIILNDSRPARKATSDQHLDPQLPQMLGVFKQRIMQLNLCRLGDPPKEFEKYYRNEIMKKVLLQFLGKCSYNLSLIEVLLASNDFLRFAVVVCVKSVLFEGTLLSKFSEEVGFDEEVKMFVSFFSYLFPLRNPLNLSEGKPRRLFTHEPNQLRTPHYLLQASHNAIFLYRKEVQLEPLQEPSKEAAKVRLPSQSKAIEKREGKEGRMRSKKKGFFSCFPCFR